MDPLMYGGRRNKKERRERSQTVVTKVGFLPCISFFRMIGILIVIGLLAIFVEPVRVYAGALGGIVFVWFLVGLFMKGICRKTIKVKADGISVSM